MSNSAESSHTTCKTLVWPDFNNVHFMSASSIHNQKTLVFNASIKRTYLMINAHSHHHHRLHLLFYLMTWLLNSQMTHPAMIGPTSMHLNSLVSHLQPNVAPTIRHVPRSHLPRSPEANTEDLELLNLDWLISCPNIYSVVDYSWDYNSTTTSLAVTTLDSTWLPATLQTGWWGDIIKEGKGKRKGKKWM
jgi:hypothetical protein